MAPATKTRRSAPGSATGASRVPARALSRPVLDRYRTISWRFLLVICVGVALAVGSGWALFASSWLAVQHVQVSGERTLSVRQVQVAAAVQLGTPLVRLDLAGIQRRVSTLPAVASVTVHRDWPQTVQISLTERRPVAIVRNHGRWAEVDKTGVAFRHLTRKPALPVIALSAPRTPALLSATASVVASLPADLLSRMKSMHAHSVDSIVLQLKDGRQVHWGSATRNRQKIRVVRVLLKQSASVYDVSVPAQPTTSR